MPATNAAHTNSRRTLRHTSRPSETLATRLHRPSRERAPAPHTAPKARAIEAVLDAATTTSKQTDPTQHASDRAATTRTSPRPDDEPAPTSHKARSVLRNANDAPARRQRYRAEQAFDGLSAHDNHHLSRSSGTDHFSARRCRSQT